MDLVADVDVGIVYLDYEWAVDMYFEDVYLHGIYHQTFFRSI